MESVYKNLVPYSTEHSEEKKLLYAEHKQFRFMIGGDVDYVVRAKYLLNDVIVSDYFLDRELIPGFRAYLESKGYITSVRQSFKDKNKDKDDLGKHSIPGYKLKHPGFTFTYKGNTYDHCLFHEPDRNSDSFVLSNPNYRLRVPFTIPGMSAGINQARVRVIDDDIYAWLKENDFIMVEYGKTLYGRRTVPEVKLNVPKLLEKGRLGKVIAKYGVIGKNVIGEDHVLLACMMPEMIKVRQEYDDKLRKASFDVEFAEENGSDADYKEKEKALYKLQKEYDEAFINAANTIFSKFNNGVPFVERFHVNVANLESVKKGQVYKFPEDSALAGWCLPIKDGFIEDDNKDKTKCFIAIPVGEPCILVNGNDKKKVSFKRLLVALQK